MRLLVVASILLAGCCSLPFSPDSVSVNAPAVGGVDGRTLTVHVMAPDLPADGVAVWVFWDDPDNARDLYLLGLRTASGKVEAWVPTDRRIHLAVGGESWTDEWLLDVAPAGNDDVAFTARVYPRTVEGKAEGQWSPAAVAAAEYGGMLVAWQMLDVLPGATPETRNGFSERLAGLHAQLNWTNTITQRADLGLGSWHAASDGLRCTFHNGVDDLLEDGLRREAYDSVRDGVEADAWCADVQRSQNLLADPDPPVLVLGPATGQPALMPLGLPFALNYTLTFGYPRGIEELCDRIVNDPVLHYVDPSTGAVTRTATRETYASPGEPFAVVVALLAAALLFRRR